MTKRIYLSPPHMSGNELKLIEEAFKDNWIAPVGPHVTAFEEEFCRYVGLEHGVALSSGTAGIHLGLQLLGIQAGDEVVVSDFTFIGSVNPIIYLGATPIFMDSERISWNMDPELLEGFLSKRAEINRLPKAVVIVHLYGQSANNESIKAICDRFEVPLFEDAAEALGTRYKHTHAGTSGELSAFSFNGNKIITTSGGGMLVSNNRALIEKARYLATQAREPAPHYEHVEIGYNYRLSNILAGIGRAQLSVLENRVKRKREIFAYYFQCLNDLPGLEFMPEADWGIHTRWLTVITINPDKFGADREIIRQELEKENIESRPTWKPMHLQPVFEKREFVGSGVSKDLFISGLCLPSGTSMHESDLERIVSIIRNCYKI